MKFRIAAVLLFSIIACKKKSDAPQVNIDFRQDYYGVYPCKRIHFTKALSDTVYHQTIDSDYVEFVPGDHDSDMKAWLFDLKRVYTVKMQKDFSLNFGIPADSARILGLFFQKDSLHIRYQAYHATDYFTFRGAKEK